MGTLIQQKKTETITTQTSKKTAFFEKQPIQRKLSIGASNDAYEVEADAMADQVVSVSDSQVNVNQYSGALVQRKCAACEEESLQKKTLAEKITPLIQKKEQASEDGTASQELTQQIYSSKGGGQKMDSGTKSFMEGQFGTDFSAVNIHTGSRAIQMSRELNAQAFTVGNDVYFNEGKYNPATYSGKHLLAHELTHTLQQNGVQRKMIQAKKHVFTPGRPAHNHKPLGVWPKVQADAKKKCGLLSKEGRISCVCSKLSPKRVFDVTMFAEFRDKPIAKRHLNHYFNGGGKTIIENNNLEFLIRNDEKVRNLLASKIKTNKGHFFLQQSDYGNQDLRYAFGGVDRFEWEVDTKAKTVDFWFIDRYDFHPVGFGYKKHKGPGDIKRITNCVHAAAVELKSSGAADFWMKGQVTLPLSLFKKAKKPSGGGGGSVL